MTTLTWHLLNQAETGKYMTINRKTECNNYMMFTKHHKYSGVSHVKLYDFGKYERPIRQVIGTDLEDAEMDMFLLADRDASEKGYISDDRRCVEKDCLACEDCEFGKSDKDIPEEVDSPSTEQAQG